METKSNQPAESAATDQLSTSNNKAANQSKKSTHKIKTVSMFHEEECFICHKNAGEQENTSFIGCSFCPKSYHLSCLPAGTIITSPRWGCPAHKCATCGAPSSKSRGKMFRCVSCPTALCSLHVPKDCKVVPQNILEERGYSSSSFHFIFCHKCEDLDSKSTGQKRTASEAGLDIASILKKRKVGSNQMVKSPPDEQILIPMRGLFSSGFVFQKQVADEIGISQPLLSQYVHGATRNNGWRFLEEKLKIWLDKHTDLIARLESEAKSVEPQVQPQQPIIPEPIIKREPIHHHHQRAASNDVKIRLRLNTQSQPDLQPKEQPMWEPHRNFIPVLTTYEIAALQQQEENNSLILGESPTFYGSDSSEIEAEETGVWAIDIFQQHNNRSQETAYY